METLIYCLRTKGIVQEETQLRQVGHSSSFLLDEHNINIASMKKGPRGCEVYPAARLPAAAPHQSPQLTLSHPDT